MKLLIIFIFSLSVFSNESLINVSFGPATVGTSNVNIDLRDFQVKYVEKSSYVKAYLIKNSIQWIRDKNNLLTPRARIRIFTEKLSHEVFIQYLGRSIIPTKSNKSKLYTDLYINLFTPGNIEVYQNNKIISKITVVIKKNLNNKNKIHIDDSCLKYSLSLKGQISGHASVGCRMDRVGKWGKETPRLEVTWSATDLFLANKTPPPFTIFLKDSSPARIRMVDQNNQTKKIEIQAKLPKRLHRLKTAIGLGPYTFDTSVGGTKKKRVAPAFMLYGRLDLTKSSSFRLFDALIWNKAIFNNFGVYFAYDLASAYDRKINLTTLLGVQGLSFKEEGKNQKSNFDMIYPQGFEVVYNNAFNIKKFHIAYGMFLGNSNSYKYKNIWLRWGKKYFWEINLIDWKKDQSQSTMWGLSVGIPFKGFF